MKTLSLNVYFSTFRAKRLKVPLLILLAGTSIAAAEEIPDEAIVVSPAERRFVVQKILDMQERIDSLEKQLKNAKEMSGCA